MSVHFDQTKQMFIVRKYTRGIYRYIGQYETLEEAEAAEAEWKEQQKNERAEDKLLHTIEWFEAKSREQLKTLPSKYPGYLNGRVRKVQGGGNA